MGIRWRIIKNFTNPDELVDKAINDIGFDNIITKAMEGKKGRIKREDYLIQDQNDLADY